MIAAAQQKAQEIGVPMNIAIVDEGDNLVAFARMDGAWLGSIGIAHGKAYTARAFDMPTRELAEKAQPGQPLFGIEATNPGRIVIFPGGVPLTADGTVVGAIGVSGGVPDHRELGPRRHRHLGPPAARPAHRDSRAAAAAPRARSFPGLA